MGYEAHAPNLLILLLVAVAASFEELREKWDRLMEKLTAKMVK